MGACVPTPGSPGSLCAPCGGAADCGDADDACLRYPDGTSACGSACGNCPSDFACAAVQGLSAPQCVRVVDGVETCDGYLATPPTPPGPAPDAGVGGGSVGPGSGRSPSPGTLGANCEFNADCGSGLCVDHEGGRVCTEACDDNCQTGFACIDYEMMGLCMPDRTASAAGGTIVGGCRAAPGRTLPIGAAWGVLLIVAFWRRTRR